MVAARVGRAMRKPQLVFAVVGALLWAALWLVPKLSASLLHQQEGPVATLISFLIMPGFIIGTFFQGLAGGSIHGGGKMWVFILFSTIGNALLLYFVAILVTDVFARFKANDR